MAEVEPLSGKMARCIFVVTETGGHDVRLRDALEVGLHV
jgi:hypothetical protein